jgi:hypothetical protein
LRGSFIIGFRFAFIKLSNTKRGRRAAAPPNPQKLETETRPKVWSGFFNVRNNRKGETQTPKIKNFTPAGKRLFFVAVLATSRRAGGRHGIVKKQPFF